MIGIAGLIAFLIGLAGFLDVVDMRPAVAIVLVLGGLMLVLAEPRVRSRL